MPRRECLGCRRLIPSGSRCARCDTHSQDYGRAYEVAKQDPAYRYASQCCACNEPFTSDNPKTAGHVEALRFGTRLNVVVPTCRRCNSGWRASGL
jgi:hypothetical protein